MPEENGMQAMEAVLANYGTSPQTTAETTEPAPEAEPATAPEATGTETAPAEGTTAPAEATSSERSDDEDSNAGQDTDSTSPEEVFQSKGRNAAFAEMRIQNQRMKDVVDRMGSLMGLPDQLPEEQRMAMISQRVLELQAKATNTPVELAQKEEELARKEQEFQSETLRQNALLSFQRVKDTFELDDAGLREFAEQLSQNEINPFQQPVDLVAQYRLLNFDRLMTAAQEKARQEALAAQRRTNERSTSPSKTNGGPTQQAPEVKSFSDFERMMRNFPG